jgi:hypothetical protein
MAMKQQMMLAALATLAGIVMAAPRAYDAPPTACDCSYNHTDMACSPSAVDCEVSG